MPAKRKPRSKSPSRSSPYRVFISHSSADLWIAEQISKEIKALGAKPWLDELEMEGGDNIKERVIKGITSCREAIVLITPQSVKSRWVSFEIGAAFGLRKRVTPILHYVSHDKIDILADVKSIELNRFKQFLTQLRQRVKR